MMIASRALGYKSTANSRLLWLISCCFIFCGYLFAAEATPEILPEPKAPQFSEFERQDQLLEAQITQGEGKWLNTDEGKFLALFKAQETAIAKGSVLWLTAPRDTFMSPGIAQTALDFLPKISWHTLVMHPVGLDFSGPKPLDQVIKQKSQPSMAPVAEQETEEATEKANDIATPNGLIEEGEWYAAQTKANLAMLLPRVQAAEKALLSQNGRYILIAQSVSGQLLLDAIKAQQLNPLAVILIDVSHPRTAIQRGIGGQINELNIPLLDIYSTADKRHAEQRRRSVRNPNYQQLWIPAVDSRYRGAERLLLGRIRAWLDKHDAPT